MTTDNPYAATTGTRSPEYNDGLTVQDTTHSAAPAGIPTSAAADSDTLRTDETHDLISADKVVGTAVYDASGERLGTVDSIMLGKTSGKVAYAVMSFGGFLGIGERYHPLPWNVLTYDEAKGGYNIQHTADDLRDAPNYSRDEVDTLDYGQRSGEIDDYYGVNIPHGRAAGVETADAIGSTTGAGSSGMASTGMGANRNF
ncbi:PRC-barrel domain-containing protein [Polymorphobacter sp. PAMC 29334]|uniref:PRC-barrel domain-containing protein n=1 Tax=Polymorphobacter sp. PAMC 29334 TaxID=2862331 RepID=UPI001C66DA41|nr:PRC-barrel domain-containing protein [Polymorphobacter sp. PAMC 29334]QYE34341.1 PRC-barrel domain-containing protein [Polymorphobacter sp. PAMC 29334]